MHAVIRTGGKQYRVAAQDVIEIEKLPGEKDATVTFDEVLAVGSTIGAPLVQGATVTGKIVAQDRAPHILMMKHKRRHNYKRIKGHRQRITVVRIESISAG
jgi:large subunit ribosomal protein L21